MNSSDIVMVASHNHILVALSVGVSILAAYATIALVQRLRDARGRLWLAWLVGGAIADGIGTWSMHYTGMLALRLPVAVSYDVPMVVLSLLVIVLGSGAAFLVLSGNKINRRRVLAASIFLGGIGVSGLHYTAMEAMRYQGMHSYLPAGVVLSAVLAVVPSYMALLLIFRFQGYAVGERPRLHGSALLRGVTNPAMHYTAMAATVFTQSVELPDLSHAVSIAAIGTLGITIVPLMVIVVTLLTTLADRLHKQSDQLRLLTAKVQSTREEEATRIAREVHDVLGSSLTSLRWELEAIDEAVSEASNLSQLDDLPQKTKSMIKLIDQAVNTVRRISLELRPPGLDQLGLAEAIEWQAQRFQAQTGITCTCDCTQENLELEPAHSNAVFRISQEALTNVLRHAGATKVEIKLERQNRELVLTIKDNGRGIAESEKLGRQSLGILGMRERAYLIGARIKISGVEGQGTVITVRVPIR